MPGGVTVSVVGESADVMRMLHLERKLAPPNLADFLNRKVDPYLRVRAKNRFGNEGDDVVGKWKELAPFTQSLRASQGYGPSHPINRRTGQLENYITNGPNKLTVDPAGVVLTLPGGSPSGTLGSKVRIAQQGGESNVKGTRPTPARPVVGINERDLLAILTLLAHEIEDQS